MGPALRSLISRPTAGSTLFGLYTGVADDRLFNSLRVEAEGAQPYAEESLVIEDFASEWRGGRPARAYRSAPGGAIQDAFYGSVGLSDIVSWATGRTCAPTATRGTYNYYARVGDHLSLHRDVDGCDVAVITCLHRRSGSAGGGGYLSLYPHCADLPLSAARSASSTHLVDLAEGETLIMLGGIVPHRLEPLRSGDSRIVSVLCFRFV